MQSTTARTPCDLVAPRIHHDTSYCSWWSGGGGDPAVRSGPDRPPTTVVELAARPVLFLPRAVVLTQSSLATHLQLLRPSSMIISLLWLRVSSRVVWNSGHRTLDWTICAKSIVKWIQPSHLQNLSSCKTIATCLLAPLDSRSSCSCCSVLALTSLWLYQHTPSRFRRSGCNTVSECLKPLMFSPCSLGNESEGLKVMMVAYSTGRWLFLVWDQHGSSSETATWMHHAHAWDRGWSWGSGMGIGIHLVSKKKREKRKESGSVRRSVHYAVFLVPRCSADPMIRT
jgi:hypothetical protein